ncbi:MULTISPECIES: hypothetical protein [unclassified Micromonospora]|uniref:hypothetical protein n=1 Tax=unclassified Micromonospora TaxID=2617518 RepID=UPI0024163123|nr:MULTISPECIES: hypothetical protein [unclassified Micromonospora]MDG4820143.1 hypothetical protein [Micromonospora sp. WMMD956]WFE56555.1 hypothetical protein O7633_06530 [Micromonospora sp. WMMD712]
MLGYPELTCYTTNLVACLEPTDPAVRQRLADGVRLAVRTDLPDGLAFSHHPRLDVDDRGYGLTYRSAPAWEPARAELRAELAEAGQVLACGDTYQLPWSPSYGRTHAPHWLLLREHDQGRWLVADHFAALTPAGWQDPYLGWLDDAQLSAALRPIADPAPEQVDRDRYALGTPVELPPVTHVRWLARHPDAATTREGTWIDEPGAALRHVAQTLLANGQLLARHIEDLWAASRHFRYRHGEHAAAGRIDPHAAQVACDAWEQLPRALRFAADSATRGRPRPGVLTQAFDQLISTLPACVATIEESP